MNSETHIVQEEVEIPEWLYYNVCHACGKVHPIDNAYEYEAEETASYRHVFGETRDKQVHTSVTSWCSKQCYVADEL